MIPSRYTLRVRRLVESEDEDDFGIVETSWQEHDWRVRSIDPGASVELYQPNRDLSRVVFTIHADKTDDVPGVRDQVLVDGDWYDVDGAPSDYSRGPWQNPVAGVVVMLRRSEG